ncbi:DUF2019 domain-containing protein [Nitratireductor sp. GCM10026969]|uniref:DUF2019 domain-containing protein n=1 Tax=Nitratireductor sp. GCM10026969 TaxID=3252645 RepID=UPI00360EF97D
MTEQQTLDALVQRFVDVCLAQDDALRNLDTRRYNKLYDQLTVVAEELKSRDGDQRHQLLELYSHPNAQVRLKAAIHTLTCDRDGALQVLQQIIDRKEQPQTPYAWGMLDAIREGRYVPR